MGAELDEGSLSPRRAHLAEIKNDDMTLDKWHLLSTCCVPCGPVLGNVGGLGRPWEGKGAIRAESCCRETVDGGYLCFVQGTLALWTGHFRLF